MRATPASLAPLLAVSRWGLGARAGELDDARRDPMAWVTDQLAAPPAPLWPEGVPTAREGETLIEADRTDPRPPGQQMRAAEALQTTQAALTTQLLSSTTSVLDRLTLFWANHLTVSSRAGATRAVLGDFVLSAIRPHVLGRFEDMLLAATRHPAMLRYLDQNSSMGPNSPAGLNQKRGLNENLARELLELHTISPTAGYSQADVTELARILTGWGIGGTADATYLFRQRAHEPGPKTLLGRRFEEGEQAGIGALAMLANHPSTHRFLATKLVRHFVSDQPDPGLVGRIGKALERSSGHLGVAVNTLARDPSAWAEPQAKLRTPIELVIATLRATGDQVPPRQLIGAFWNLGQPFLGAPGPNGWPDEATPWIGPEAVLRRIEWIRATVARTRYAGEPLELLDAVLAEGASPATRDAVRRAPSRAEGLALVLASPEFQRR